MENLTTPEIKEYDASLPGENWFFYWRTSSSLWEAKLKEYQGPTPLFVPINWAFHSEYSDFYDFGEQKPETNLARLSQIAANLGKPIIFLVPITPTPFMVNSGVPSYLARNLSENQDKVALAAFDSSSQLNKVFSYYDPKIFQAFRKFTYNLNSYFSRTGVTNSIYGLVTNRVEEGHIVSYFKDHSKVFEEGFNRYLKQIQDTEPEKIERLKNDAVYVKDLKHEYSLLISSLYLNGAEETLAAGWKGQIEICLLGGNSEDLFRRGFDSWESQDAYFEPLFKSVVYGVYPCSALLPARVKDRALEKALQDINTSRMVNSMLQEEFYSEDSSMSYSPLTYFEFADGGEGHFSFERAMEQSGLAHFFENEYPWSYNIRKEFQFEFDDLDTRKVYFFFGERLDQKSLNLILKLFMNGQKIFLDICHLDEKLAQKYESFLVENDITVEKINYLSLVTKASLGEGLILTFNRRSLGENSLIKRKGFWETMINYLDIKHMKVDCDQGVHYFWKARAANSYELNYEEIRRVFLYNPTSYKRKVQLKSSSFLAFIKSVDERNVAVKSTPIGIEILMYPGASVALDFGYFEP